MKIGKNLIILILTALLLQGCRICCSSGEKHYNTRYLTNKTTCIDSIAPCIDVPDIVSITDIVGKQVNTLSDGVYLVKLSNNTYVMIIN